MGFSGSWGSGKIDTEYKYESICSAKTEIDSSEIFMKWLDEVRRSTDRGKIMKQLRKTEWRGGYPIKKNLVLCAWGVLAVAGFAGILARPENIPSLAACVLALAGAVLSLPRLLGYYRTAYQCLPALNRRLTKKEQEELLECENFETITELKSGSLRRTDFAESARWLRINGRYIPKELVIL